MIVADLIKINGEAMKFLSNHGIHITDYKYSDLFEDYNEMVRNKEKKEYIYMKLSEEYNVPVRTLRRIIKRMSANC